MQTTTPDQVHIPEPVDAEIIDHLIPQSWSRWKRLGALAIAGGLLVAGSVAWFGGWVNPNVHADINEWGGDGPITLAIRLTNDGPRSLEVQSVEQPAGLQILTLQATPVTILCTDLGGGGSSCVDEFGAELSPGADIVVEPGGAIVLRATYDVTDCAALDGLDTSYDVVLRYQSGAPWWSSTQQFYTGDWGLSGQPDDNLPAGWPQRVAQYACGFTLIDS